MDLAKTDVGRNITEREVKNLPLVSRNPYNFALLEGGVDEITRNTMTDEVREADLAVGMTDGRDERWAPSVQICEINRRDRRHRARVARHA